MSTENRHGEDRQTDPRVEPSDSHAVPPANDDGAEILILDPRHAPDQDQATEEVVILDLEDLLPDTSGEIVLFAGEEMPVNIVTDESMTEAGIAEAHVTATGVDVTGLHFYSFEGGITIYSPTDLSIVTDSGGA